MVVWRHALVAAGMLACLCTAARARTIAPGPLAVTGPVPVTATSHPFGAVTNIDLARFGYVEEEYFVTGKANVYRWNAAATAAEVETPNAPFTTRIVVIRPTEGAHFSGRVMVDIVNMSNGWDFNKMWAVMHPHLLQNGWAYIGVTAKPNAVKALKAFDPERYKSLSWENPLSPDDSRNCAKVPPDSARATENGLVWDILADVGAWAKSDAADNPLAKLGVKRVYLTGYSQSARFLYTYIDAIHPLVRLPGGKPVYDGFLFGGAVAGAPWMGGINQCSDFPQPPDVRARLMAHDVPAISVEGAMDVLGMIGNYAIRQDDGDAPDGRFRLYEVAGGSHSWMMQLGYNVSHEDVKQAGFSNFADVVPPACAATGNLPQPARMHYVFDAALESLDRWAAMGEAPPRAPRLEVEGASGALDYVYDGTGNQAGGFRLPSISVPIAEHRADNGPNWREPSGCWSWAYVKPYDRARLKALYPTHAVYVAAVRQAVDTLVSRKLLTRFDGDDIVRDAANANVPD